MLTVRYRWYKFESLYAEGGGEINTTTLAQNYCIPIAKWKHFDDSLGFEFGPKVCKTIFEFRSFICSLVFPILENPNVHKLSKWPWHFRTEWTEINLKWHFLLRFVASEVSAIIKACDLYNIMTLTCCPGVTQVR